MLFTFRPGLTFLCLSSLIGVSRAIWNTPPFLKPDPIEDVVEFKGYNTGTKRTNINLNEEVPQPVIIASVNYEGDIAPQVGNLEDGKSNFMLGAEVKKDSGVWKVYITKKQDYETPVMRDYRFGIIIGNEQYTIALNIINIDDNAPVIQANEKNCMIEENYSGPTNCSYSIRDADGWIDQVKVKFSSVPEDGTGNFKITTKRVEGVDSEYKINGYLEVIKPLDFETIPMYMLLLNATDGANNRGSLLTVVEVIDMPDEPPRWTRITAAENILEKSYHTFSVSAIDGDIQINAEINYKIIPEIESEGKYFHVESTTGDIKINPIDRDSLKKEIFRFIIVAYEKLNTTSAINATILIILEDLNDHIPEILPNKLSIDIKEETYMSLDFNPSIVINDPDLAENGQYSVSLIDHSDNDWSSAFLIVPNNGYQETSFTMTVTNASLLDYEDEKWRKIEIEIEAVEVADKKHIGRQIIEINLINWNDEMPIFENDALQVNIKEDVEKGFFIAKMLATDRDVDDNVTHTIISQKGLKIDEKTGVIITAENDALDYESIPIVVVQIVATDLADHKAYATLTINVIDVNDVPPKLYFPKQIPSLIEEQKIGTVVNAKITASDPDTDAHLIFSIDWDTSTANKRSVLVNESFYRNQLEILTEYPEGHTREAEAKLVVKGRIDYEAFDVMFLTIVVTDTTTVHNDNATFATLTLNIIDINDNWPKFQKVEEMSVSENSVFDTLIGAVIATDDDGPQFNKVVYYIESTNNTRSDLVKIDKLSGIIRVDLDKGIDAEEYEFIYYTVIASDGENNSTLSLAIYVVDMNDEEPKLLSDKFESTKHIREKSPNGTEIVQIYAIDRDRTYPFNNVSFVINANYSAPFQYFNLSKFGGLLKVSLADGYILDRDFGASSYTLDIKLRDNYLVDGITWNTNAIDTVITVILDDINDQIPKLPDLGMPAKTITENLKKDILIMTIEAQDHDDPTTDNTKVTYKMQSQSRIDNEADKTCENPFKVETEKFKQAHIISNKDLKGCYGTWAIELYAEDMGKDPGPLNDTKIYHIQVTDYNYYDPVIEVPIIGTSIALSNDQSLHTRLKTHDKQPLPNFKATDEDYGASGTVKFSISSINNDDKYFEIVDIEKNMGQLQLKSWPPNIEENDRFIITLTATDGGDPPRHVSNDHTIIFVSTLGPKFKENDWMVWIKENTTGLNFSTLIPEAFDNINDGGTNIVPVYYFIDDKLGDFKYFNVDKVTRNLSLEQELDREKKATMWFDVITTADSDGPPRDPRKEAVLNITVIVVDENDNPPIFDAPTKFYSGGVAMEDAVDKVILTVKATDADLNDTLTYSKIESSLITSDSSISGISNPFSLNDNTGELLLKFSVTSNMVGFFQFNTIVHDAVGHNDTAKIQVYIVSQTNRVEFTFKNSPSYVKEEVMFLIKTFSDAFGYLCNIDDIKSSVDANDHVLDNVTTVTTHFIDSMDNLPIGSDTAIRLSSDLQTVTNLKASLQGRGLFLIDVPTGSSTDTSDPQQTIQWILISLTIFFCLSTIVILVVYFVRTQSLIKRLDKIAVGWKSDDKEKDMDRNGAVPGTNQFALAGSNPMWNTVQDSINREHDNISQRSGDSDLIGIEDDFNFGYNNDTSISKKEWEKSHNGMRPDVPVLYFKSNYNEDNFSEDKC